MRCSVSLHSTELFELVIGPSKVIEHLGVILSLGGGVREQLCGLLIVAVPIALNAFNLAELRRTFRKRGICLIGKFW